MDSPAAHELHLDLGLAAFPLQIHFVILRGGSNALRDSGVKHLVGLGHGSLQGHQLQLGASAAGESGGRSAGGGGGSGGPSAAAAG